MTAPPIPRPQSRRLSDAPPIRARGFAEVLSASRFRDAFPYRVVLISGPARVGKNRAATCLAGRLQADHFALSNMLKRLTHEHHGLDGKTPPLHFEWCKDRPREEFGGATPRAAYIRFSEEIMKPEHGEGYLGRQAGKRVEGNLSAGRISIVSGVGFFQEVRPIVEAAGAARCLHVALDHADGAAGDFPDSRESLDLEPLGMATVRLAYGKCRQFLQALEAEISGVAARAGR